MIAIISMGITTIVDRGNLIEQRLEKW